MYDVPKEQYVTVIREMIRHENDLTNHRTMWLLIVQGLLANAYVAARGGLHGKGEEELAQKPARAWRTAGDRSSVG